MTYTNNSVNLSERLISWAQNEENIDGHYLEHGRDCLEAAAVIRELAAALEGLFEHCVMIHKHWGDGSNAQQANEAQKRSRTAIAKVQT